MKRGAISHPKMKRLAKILKLRLFGAVGIFEMLLHFTAEYAPAGDIGKFSDDEIAGTCDWFRDSSELVAALVQVGCVDTHPTCRLIVHDWSEHADDGVDAKLYRWHTLFADGKQPRGKRLSKKEKDTLEGGLWAQCGHNVGRNGHGVALPSPALALPSPALASTPKPPRKKKSLVYCKAFNEWWELYPRKEGKADAYKAWANAGKDIRTQKDWTAEKTVAFLLERVTAYAISPRATKSDYDKIPHAERWLNSGRYEDAPEAWQTPLTDARPEKESLGPVAATQPDASELEL